MVFLLLRFLPYFIPVCYFALAKAIFYYTDWWWLFLLIGLLLTLLNFMFFKLKNRQKPVLGLAVFAVIYYLSGLAYFLVLENAYVINLFLLMWSLIFWLYLEAVFHDFYETTHTHILNLQNISLYADILIIFFLTSSLISFSIFLNWSEFGIILILGLVYLTVINFAFTKQQISRDDAWVYASIIALVLVEILIAIMYLPTSFYVASIIVSLVYYFLSSITLLSLKKQLTNKLFWRYSIICLIVGVAVFLTATWI